VKQKSQAFAAFLGVLTFSLQVVRGCCIPNTILDGFAHCCGLPRIQKDTLSGRRTESAELCGCGYRKRDTPSAKKAAAFPPRPFRRHEAFKPDEASVVVITTI
jgi:hypothetical protein